MRFLRLLTNSLLAGALGAAYLTILVLQLNPQVPLGRPGKPEEVAALVSWLCTDEAAYVTGSSYVMDGGMIQQVVSIPA